MRKRKSLIVFFSHAHSISAIQIGPELKRIPVPTWQPNMLQQNYELNPASLRINAGSIFIKLLEKKILKLLKLLFKKIYIYEKNFVAHLSLRILEEF